MPQAPPPGWPADVPPPGAPGWEHRAVLWLLDRCPPEYREYDLLRRHPAVLARFAVEHLNGALTGARSAYSGARRDLRDVETPETVAAALVVLEREGARLAATLREAGLVEEALRGRRWSARL